MSVHWIKICSSAVKKKVLQRRYNLCQVQRFLNLPHYLATLPITSKLNQHDSFLGYGIVDAVIRQQVIRKNQESRQGTSPVTTYRPRTIASSVDTIGTISDGRIERKLQFRTDNLLVVRVLHILSS
jgi:hypothetical protein